MPSTCILCKHTTQNDGTVKMFRFPSNPVIRKQWLHNIGLKEQDLRQHSRLCSRHFRNGDKTQLPTLHLGKRFASPRKNNERGKRAAKFAQLSELSSSRKHLAMTPHTDLDNSASSTSTDISTPVPDVMLVSAGEELVSDYQIHELPQKLLRDDDSSDTDDNGLENTVALKAHIEFLEAEKKMNNKQLESISSKPQYFRLEEVSGDDNLMRFYTGFISYEVFLAVFEFLGPSVNKLQYWGTKASQIRKSKLDPKNQFFLTLIRLRQNARVKDLAYRFGISTGLVSKYFTTWICFLYQHLKEVEWMPSPEQVAATLPNIFKEKYPSTFVIIDASEIFIETPSDLVMQSSTWSNYKHNNTAKFLVGCTPNGTICYVSPLYVGAISDVELTKVSGFLSKLPHHHSPTLSVMADRGFTVQDQLKEIGIDLNIPPFLSGRKQLPKGEVESGRKIASLRIHVERCIGRIKNFAILSSTLPLSMARLANQIVCVCAWLTSFQPALVPPPCAEDDEDEVDEYFLKVFESDYEADDSSDESSAEEI